MPRFEEIADVSREQLQRYLTLEQVEALDDAGRMRYLQEMWSMSAPLISGTLERRSTKHGWIWWLTVVTDLDGHPLEYPLADLRDRSGQLQRGVYVGTSVEGVEEGQFVQAVFDLSPEREREKWENPLLIRVHASTMRPLARIPPAAVRHREDGSVDVDASLYHAFIEREHPELMEQLREAEERIEKLQKKGDDLNERNAAAAKEAQAQKREAANAAKALREAEAERDRILADIEAGFQAERTRREEELVKLEADLKARRGEAYKNHNQELEQLKKALAEAEAMAQAETQRLMDQTKRLRDYISERADRLLDLDFITAEQHADLFPRSQEPDGAQGDFISFDEIDGGHAGVVAHVQRYLYGKRIVYPRALLENFLALLRTGDLIILSGLSGSGKTQLVKAFAEATGNVAHVVPVKPNWTSSEDLLGYYNPLQRSYLTTPFLDALIAAQRDPGRLHLVCLDEMNLARVEYYFADFLSALEERTDAPRVELYSGEEAGHVEAEFRLFVDVLFEAAEGRDLRRLGDFLRQEDVVNQLKGRLGIEDGESIIQLHSRLRRMVSGVLNVPASLRFPENVRVIGAVNIDDTTHYLSPKVLDRAHVVQFQSPLAYWEQVDGEVGGAEVPEVPVRVPAGEFSRVEYPAFDPSSDDRVSSTLASWATDYLAPLGVDIGLRTIRQSILYRDRLREVMGGGDVEDVALNNVVRQKLLPRFSFDGKQKPRGTRSEKTCGAVVKAFQKNLAAELPDIEPFNAKRELAGIMARAESADMIFNYWA